MAAIISSIMTDLETQLNTYAPTHLTVFRFPPQQAVAPFCFVNLPETIEYDATFGRGQDRFTIEVFVCVASVTSRDMADAMTAYAAGDSTGIKHAIEASTVHDYRVTQATFTQIGLAAATYQGVVFTVDVGA